MTELALMRIIGLKGRVGPDGVAAALRVDADDVAGQVRSLIETGLAVEAKGNWRLTPDGRARLAEAIAKESAGVDQAAMTTAYDEFCAHNADLKQIITDWQLKGSVAEPNDHTDAAYDAAVLARLAQLHRGLGPLLDRLGRLAPRLTRYAPRLDHAAHQIAAGEVTFVARPTMDSYHTVWFELHEDLIGLCGFTRADEAATGRAH